MRPRPPIPSRVPGDSGNRVSWIHDTHWNPPRPTLHPPTMAPATHRPPPFARIEPFSALDFSVCHELRPFPPVNAHFAPARPGPQRSKTPRAPPRTRPGPLARRPAPGFTFAAFFVFKIWGAFPGQTLIFAFFRIFKPSILPGLHRVRGVPRAFPAMPRPKHTRYPRAPLTPTVIRNPRLRCLVFA